jgi:RNA polymerase sigma-70 factor (ECF subfamily)
MSVHDNSVNKGGFDHWGMLVSAAQRGDEVAYETFLVELQAWLLRYYRHRFPSSAIDDAVQEALLAVHAKKQTYDRARPFGPWLTAIVRYKWIDWVRRLKREGAVPLANDVQSPDQGSRCTSAILLAELIAYLNPAQAEVIRLVKLNGASIQEASDATGQSTSLVKVNIHRGLKRLAAILATQTGPSRKNVAKQITICKREKRRLTDRAR